MYKKMKKIPEKHMFLIAIKKPFKCGYLVSIQFLIVDVDGICDICNIIK